MQVSYPILGLGQAKQLVAICGGGGSARTGVKNTVDVYAAPTATTGYTLLGSADTGTELASGLAISPDSSLLAVSINASCWLYAIAYEETKADFALTLLVKFRTDFAGAESGQSSVCFVGNHTLLTGGEDSVIRSWSIATNVTTKGWATAPALDGAPDMMPALGDSAIGDTSYVQLVGEFKAHTKRIKQIHVDAFSRQLVVSSDEAASCHLWWLHEGATITCSLSQADALAACFAAYPKSLPPPPKGAKQAPTVFKHQFRCVRFAPNGQFLMTVLSPPRGDAFLIKWVPVTTSQIDASSWPWQIAAIAVAGNEPVGSCCISVDGQLVATATASGDVQTFSTATLEKVRREQLPEEHTFAVTGMAFVPQDDGYRLCTAGADKRLLVHAVSSEPVAKGFSLRSFLGRLLRFVAALGFGAIVGALVGSIALVYLHATYPDDVLVAHPFTGVLDMLAYEFQTSDASATLVALGVALLSALGGVWFCLRTSLVHGLFLHGLGLCGLSLTSLYVAIVPEMAVRWSVAPLAVSPELLGTSFLFVISAKNLMMMMLVEYKLAIVSGIACVALLILHALLVLLVRP